MQVIVVDDGKDAAENRREATQNAGLVIQYFVLDHDTGIAAARNFAISKVRKHLHLNVNRMHSLSTIGSKCNHQSCGCEPPLFVGENQICGHHG